MPPMVISVKRSLLRIVLMLPVILLPVTSFAFGAKAHRVVGYIAEQDLCEQASATLNDLLEGESLGEAGLWADRIRGNKDYDYAKPWHYINIPDGVSLKDAQRSSRGDVLWAIEEMNSRLDKEEPGSESYLEALRFLIHFVADIHQPLHVGRKEDLGGNRVKVTFYTAYGKPPGKSNLHAYWDSEVLELHPASAEDYAQRLLDRRENHKVTWAPGRSQRWIHEAMLLRAEVYDFKAFEGAETAYLDSDYLGMAGKTLGDRLYIAGRRLGAVLNYRYCDAKKPVKAAE